MAQDIKLPDLGEGITGGTVTDVLVKEGDTVAAEQPLISIETDKAVIEVPSSGAGVISKVHVKSGDKLEVGQPIVTLDEQGSAEAPKAEAPKAEAPKAEASPKAEAATQTEPASAAAAAPVAEPAPAARGKKSGKAKEDEKPAAKPAAAPKPTSEPAPQAQVSEPASVDPSASAAAPAAPSPHRGEQQLAKAASAAPSDGPIPAGPATRRLARELGVDLAEVAAAFPGQRLTEEDVKSFVKERLSAPQAAAARPAGAQAVYAQAAAGPAVPPLPDFSQYGEVERVALTTLQRKTAENLAVAWSAAPHVTQFDEVDITALEALRKRHRSKAGDSGVKLTVTAFMVKAVAIALKEFPQFNASIDMRGGELIYKRYYNMGIAVDTPAGLIVPVLRGVDRKRVLEIAAEMTEIAEKTRQRKVGLDDLRGGTFTITNLGGIGGTAFTPIINWPEVAILGLARSREQPIVREGQWATRLILPLCLSYDHRVINGADGARFIRRLAALLEDPEMLLLEG